MEEKEMKIWMGILLVVMMLTLTGCFNMASVYPLYTDQTAVAEPRLVGAWQSKDGEDEIFVKLIGDREYRLTHINDKGEASPWRVRVVKLDKTPVADIVAITDDANIPAHYFLALSFEGAALKAWFLDSSSLRQKAAGEGMAYVHGKEDKAVLTAPTASVAAFLQKNLADEMKRDPDLEFLPLK
jgi:hypothetical protein